MRMGSRPLMRWAIGAAAPLLVAGAMVFFNSVTLASYDSLELISHDSNAWYHCTSGVNQNGSHVNHCFYTPNSTNYESNWWWCAANGVAGNWCPDQSLDCGQGMFGTGGSLINESWYDINNHWLKNTNDCISTDIGHYPWQDVYGP